MGWKETKRLQKHSVRNWEIWKEGEINEEEEGERRLSKMSGG